MPTAVPTVRIEVATQSKPWWTSRVLIVNALALVVMAAEANLQLLKPLLRVDIFTTVAFVLPVLNLVLRGITTQPLGGRPAPADATPAPAAAEGDAP